MTNRDNLDVIRLFYFDEYLLRHRERLLNAIKSAKVQTKLENNLEPVKDIIYSLEQVSITSFYKQCEIYEAIEKKRQLTQSLRTCYNISKEEDSKSLISLTLQASPKRLTVEKIIAKEILSGQNNKLRRSCRFLQNEKISKIDHLIRENCQDGLVVNKSIISKMNISLQYVTFTRTYCLTILFKQMIKNLCRKC